MGSCASRKEVEQKAEAVKSAPKPVSAEPPPIQVVIAEPESPKPLPRIKPPRPKEPPLCSHCFREFNRKSLICSGDCSICCKIVCIACYTHPKTCASFSLSYRGR